MAGHIYKMIPESELHKALKCNSCLKCSVRICHMEITYVCVFVCNWFHFFQCCVINFSLWFTTLYINKVIVHSYEPMLLYCLCYLFYHDVGEIFWPQPIRCLKLGHETGQGSMSPTWVGWVSDLGKNGFHKKCKNLHNITVHLIASLQSKWKNKQIKHMNNWIW